MSRDELVAVEPAAWVEALRAAKDEGFTWFDSLGCVDEVGRADALRVVVRLVDRARGAARRLSTLVERDDPRLATVTELWVGASWYEREVHDFFGVVFVGGDQAPLLNHTDVRTLRKDFVLAARAGRAWPGAKEPGEGPTAASRRRMAPAGVPDPSVWGERGADAPVPSAAELAAAVAGGRVRRSR